jgi:preprotein translocase subunit SecF
MALRRLGHHRQPARRGHHPGLLRLFQWEFSLPVLAAVLAVLGYSVNESVVVFDRVRENFRKMRGDVPQVIDNAITSTISRTIITHGSTQLMVHLHADLRRRGAALLRPGADHRHLFGIYSSVLVASPLVMWLGVSREQFVKPQKPKEEAVV